MEPKINPNTKNCMNCYWFDFVPDHKPRTRACCYPGAIHMDTKYLEVPGPSGITKVSYTICGMWKDCGMLDIGAQKRFV